MTAKRHEPPLYLFSLLKSAILLLGLAFTSQAAAAQTFSVLYSFNGSGDGRLPVSPVILDGAGNVYGTAGGGGLGSDTGTVFEISPAGEETTLYEFTGTPDGSIPQAGLFRDATGNLYGTTRWGGVNDLGTVFEINAAGAQTVLHSFNGGDGINPDCALIRDSVGNFYGPTSGGGGAATCPSGCGTIYRVNTSGSYQALHRFNGNDGMTAGSSLLAASGGYFGTTSLGGSHGFGVVYELKTNNQLVVLYNFTETTYGRQPYANLAQDSAGNLYRTTIYGGAFHN